MTQRKAVLSTRLSNRNYKAYPKADTKALRILVWMATSSASARRRAVSEEGFGGHGLLHDVSWVILVGLRRGENLNRCLIWPRALWAARWESLATLVQCTSGGTQRLIETVRG